MKKILVGLIATVLVTLSVQPVQAEDQKVLAIIDTAIDSSKVPAVIYEACFTDSLAMACPNKQKFMEGKGSANSPVWPVSMLHGIYHGYNVTQSALVTNPTEKIVFIRVSDITAIGNFNTQPTSLVSAIKWVSENATKYSIDAVSISQSSISTNNLIACTTNTIAINSVTSLIKQNIPVFAATGNDGSSTVIGFPACIAGVTGVGALASVQSDPTKKLPNTFTSLETATNKGPGLDVVAQGVVTIIRYNGTSAEFTATSAATPIAASVYIAKNTYGAFGLYTNTLTKVLGYPYISR
jgi:hypothetical protein